MTQVHAVEADISAKTPWWRRLLAFVSLGSLVVIIGIAVAALTGIAALVVLMLLERAATG
jgi:hypothetical protein